MCKQLLFQIITPPKKHAPASLKSNIVYFFKIMVIFNVTRNKMAVQSCTYEIMEKQETKQCNILMSSSIHTLSRCVLSRCGHTVVIYFVLTKVKYYQQQLIQCLICVVNAAVLLTSNVWGAESYHEGYAHCPRVLLHEYIMTVSLPMRTLWSGESTHRKVLH